MSSGPVRDFDFHPDENEVRVFGLAELTGLVERGELLTFLSRAWPIGPLRPPAAVPPDRVPVDQVPMLSLAART